MATTVNTAFNEFLDDIVNLTSTQSDNAKSSRDFLKDKIKTLSDNGLFQKVATAHNYNFGSFARKTKIRPLDDIDIIIGLNGAGLEEEYHSWSDIELKIKQENTNTIFNSVADKTSFYWSQDVYRINSNKVKNQLISALQTISQYKKAEKHARGEAVTLELSSYEWTFDIVPAFYSNSGYWLIPNGNGHWKKTNPKIEQERVSKANQKFGGVVLNTTRLIKYWNRRGQMPNITSYVLETIILDFFDKETPKSAEFPDIRFKDALNYIAKNITSPVQDTKAIQGNINTLNWEQKSKIQTRARNDYNKALNAVSAEINDKDMKKSINIWRDIFGEEFPYYG